MKGLVKLLNDEASVEEVVKYLKTDPYSVAKRDEKGDFPFWFALKKKSDPKIIMLLF